MTILRYMGTCPKCCSNSMEGERRYNEVREECPDCGYYYECSYLSILAYDRIGRRYRRDEDVPVSVLNELRELGWVFLPNGDVIRIGFIAKDDTSRGEFHFINTWFTIPAWYTARSTQITYINLGDDELESFNANDWRLQDKVDF